MRSNQWFSPTFGFDLQNQPPRCSIKKVILKNFAIMKTPMLGSFSKKVAGLRLATLKKRFWQGLFPVNFAKFSRITPLNDCFWIFLI